jgi:nifR3 family TIM-barrel protein
MNDGSLPLPAVTALKFGNLSITPPLLLAPMAGLTHSAFRRTVLFCGSVGLLTTEMLSARRLPGENPAVSPYLIKTAEEKPLCYQLLVTECEEIPAAMDALHRFGAEAVDLNLGCPAPRVRQAGGGSLLMEQPRLVRSIVASVRRTTDLPLSAKIRLGEEFSVSRLREFCLMLEGEGIDLLTVHARLRSESFARRPHWEWIARVKEWLRIPVVANGGIFNPEDARQCLVQSGADGLMIGRGAPQRPWLFAEVAPEIYGIPPLQNTPSFPELYVLFAKGLLAFRPERRLGRLKEFTHYFAHNYSFGHHLASAVQSAGHMEEALERALSFFERSDGGQQRQVELQGAIAAFAERG